MTEENQRKLAAEEIWLDYFNRYLLEHEVITRHGYLKMSEKIREYIQKRKRQMCKKG